MTAPLINQARHIAFLVYGEVKAEAVHSVLENGLDVVSGPTYTSENRRFAMVFR